MGSTVDSEVLCAEVVEEKRGVDIAEVGAARGGFREGFVRLETEDARHRTERSALNELAVFIAQAGVVGKG